MVQASSQEAYTDVEIRILGRQPDGYPVRLTIGGGQEPARGYLSSDVLDWSSTAPDRGAGARLFKLLFADRALTSRWDAARGQHRRRRIRLHIEDETVRLENVAEILPGEENQA